MCLYARTNDDTDNIVDRYQIDLNLFKDQVTKTDRSLPIRSERRLKTQILLVALNHMWFHGCHILATAPLLAVRACP
jgi:hypothetical protein